MGRWRPPAEKKSKYITATGYKRMNDELKYLWKVKRPEVTQAVKEAAAQGDRSENAEYIYGKKQLREIDRRVRYLSKRLDDITVVDRIPDDQGTVFFGAWVTIADEEDNEQRYRIVGPDEIEASGQLISVDSPLARQLLKKQVGDEVYLQKPDGSEIWYEVIAIEYEPY
ncbi:transcription elongation factor GreB [Marinobacterium jannaschii]|uniref:transcription elongation factor GreB n=1 Tax=Marinobacterium jannaschii TaxID=64970 RepID=UPI0004873F6F|nr:transcription elongation factor GreB [Marinobacterium jannaschii]